MSLYHESEEFVRNTENATGSLKSRVFSAKGLKSKPTQVYALVAEASKWSPVLKEIIERSQLLSLERKLSPSISLLLVHDLLVSTKGIAAPARHPLRQAVERHKARLAAELTRVRVRRGFASIHALRQSLGQAAVDDTPATSAINGDPKSALKYPHPRWLRVNTLKTTLREQLSTTFAEYVAAPTLNELIACTSKSTKVLHIDNHIPDLLALPRSTELSKIPAFAQGLLIAQDKASCFPAYLLDPRPEDGDIVDACAAPGNKTTHLASLLHSRSHPATPIPRIWACEKDKPRARILSKMVDLAGATSCVTVRAGQDFLRLDPNVEPWSKVGALLLDPSCSGSGIVGRDESEAAIVLPSKNNVDPNPYAGKPRPRKRKRSGNIFRSPSPPPITFMEEVPQPDDSASGDNDLTTRLARLSSFQTKLLLHAFSFPAARKIVYSTCSIYSEENENAVWLKFLSPMAKEDGWRVLRREEQVSGMREWAVRGNAAACGLDEHGGELDVEGAEGIQMLIRPQEKRLKEEVRDACIRCEMGTKEGTQGFFVVGFVKDGCLEERAEGSGMVERVSSFGKSQPEEEWEGFGDE